MTAVRSGMLDHVGERLLDDAERGQVEAGRQAAGSADPLDGHRDPGPRGPLHQPVQVAQARCGNERGGRPDGISPEPDGRRRPDPGQSGGGFRGDLGVGLAEHAEHPLHLAQRLTAHRLDRAQRGPGLIRLAVEHVLAEAGLHADHGHAVGHHVVQFPGDPEPLRGDRIAGRPVPDVGHMGAALLDQVPDHPGDGQRQGGPGRVARALPVEVQHHALRDQQGQPAGQAGQRDRPAAGRRDHVQHRGQREERAAGDFPADDQGGQAAGQHDDQRPDRQPAADGDREGQGDGQQGQQGAPGAYQRDLEMGATCGVEQDSEDEHGTESRGAVVQRGPEPTSQPPARGRSGCSAHLLTVTPQAAPGRPPAVVGCRADRGDGAGLVRPGPDHESHSPG